MRRDVVILGSTGSIGTQALDLVRSNPDRFRVVGLTAGGSNPDLFRAQVDGVRPGVLAASARRPRPRRRRTPCDVVLNGITGAVGLRPTLAALEAGTTLALANKESLIMGGPLVLDRAKPGQIVPVDSEHSALAQCLRVSRLDRRVPGRTPPRADRERWAVPRPQPGGPRERDPGGGAGAPDLGHGAGHHHQLRDAGQQGPRGDRGAPAVRHPVRPDRGRGAPDERRALDGRVRRRLDDRAGQPADHADPDRARASTWPDRVPDTAPAVDWTRPQTWDFFPLDDEAFPAVELAREAGRRGGTAPAVYNAANEVGVDAFRAGQAGVRPDRRRRSRPCSPTHDVPSGGASLSVEDVVDADEWARRRAAEVVAAH